MGLSCVGPLIYRYFSVVNTIEYYTIPSWLTPRMGNCRDWGTSDREEPCVWRAYYTQLFNCSEGQPPWPPRCSRVGCVDAETEDGARELAYLQFPGDAAAAGRGTTLGEPPVQNVLPDLTQARLILDHLLILRRVCPTTRASQIRVLLCAPLLRLLPLRVF